jgi:tRNA(His) guanylyltransferase
MNFDGLTGKGIGELQRSMERFETYNDPFILPDHYIIVRLDAHRLGDWGLPQAEYPCGSAATTAFRDTAIGLMTTAYRVILAFHHGDEISLLVDPSENNNPLRRSKLISAFCSAASVSLLQSSGLPALFDAKVSELPSAERVLEYFLWQRRYCFRNALTITLRATLLAQGLSPEQAEKEIHGVSEEARIQKLQKLNASMSTIPHTTRRGTLFSWEPLKQRGQEHFRIKAHNSLPEDDNAFLALVTATLEAHTSKRAAREPQKQTTQQPNPKVPLSNTPTPASSAGETKPARKDNPRKGANSKTNTFVVKLAGNQ